PLVRERCPNVVVSVQSVLVPLLTQSGFPNLIGTRPPPPAFDLQVPLMNLPGVFQTTLATIPAHVPYLHARADLVEVWLREVAGTDRFRIGIGWQGSPTYKEDRYRSINLSWFAHLAAVPGVQLYSLQKGHGQEQLGSFNGPPITDLGSRADSQTGAFMDTAAI